MNKQSKKVKLCVIKRAVQSRSQRPRSFWSEDGDRDLWPGPTLEVRDSRTSRHSVHAQSQVWQIWLVQVSIYCVCKAIQNPRPGVPISCAWQKGPLGTRLRAALKNNRAYLLRTESHLNNHICQHCGMKTSTVTLSFYYVFNILFCKNSIPSFIGNLWRVLSQARELP